MSSASRDNQKNQNNTAKTKKDSITKYEKDVQKGISRGITDTDDEDDDHDDD